MTGTVRTARLRVATALGVAGGLLGVLAGAAQALVGPRIPDWTGAKLAPVGLGLLTIALSLLAVYAAHRQADAGASARSRALCSAGLLAPGLLCVTTVGRLWYLPGPLLVAAGILTITSVGETVGLLTRNWLRLLLALLGVAELLMAAGAAPALLVVGGAGGVALLLAGIVSTSRGWRLALVVIVTVPFGLLAWTALVPVLLVLAAAAVVAQVPARSAKSGPLVPVAAGRTATSKRARPPHPQPTHAVPTEERPR